MGRKLTKFETIKENIEKIVEEYKEAKSIQDERRMVELQAEYEDQKILLYSNEAYFKKLKKRDLKLKKKETEDNQKIKYINGKLRQKKIYSDNKSYIDMAEKSKTIDDYIENASHKKRNFIRRHFKKFALGVSLVAALITGGTLLSKKNSKENGEFKDIISTIETSVDNIEENKNEDSAKNNTQAEKIVIEEDTKEKDIIKEPTEMNIVEETITEERVTENKSDTKVVITSENPNTESENSKTTTKETIIPESPIEEQEPQDYKPSTDYSSKEENEGMVTTEEETTPDYPEEIDENYNTTEETIEDENNIVTTEEETTPDYPTIIEDGEEIIIDVPKEPINEPENSEEKITIVEKEEIEQLDNPIIIESDEKDVTYYEEKSENIETITKEENKSTEEDMPIEEDENDIIYYENPDVVEIDQDIIDFINNNTEIGQIYTLHM